MREPVRLLRRLLPFVSVAVFAALAYDAWIFYSRWSSKRDADRARQQDEIRRARESVDLLGGTGFRILTFYAAPNSIRNGDRAKICYGVYGAKTVRIEPPVADLIPAPTYCLEVAPHKNTEYKLIAGDGAGHTATASLVITVGR